MFQTTVDEKPSTSKLPSHSLPHKKPTTKSLLSNLVKIKKPSSDVKPPSTLTNSLDSKIAGSDNTLSTVKEEAEEIKPSTGALGMLGDYISSSSDSD